MQIVSLGALTRQRSDSEMIVNAALCACWQGSARRLKRQVDLPVWGRRSENGTSLRLVVSNLGTFAVSPLWQELRVPPIGFWGVFSALYQTCRLLSPVPRLQLRKVGGTEGCGGGLDWQALASAVPWEKERVGEVCDGCTDSYFSYNFLQAGLRLSGGEKARPA